ncbi:MAG TPA: TonB-dependent receptor plug domain-containing protein, partial [Opitutaceae bacterium]|nr:TonB-dependent receptor plug domain-containing protein [Opitutaceae bacterium]
MTSLLSARSTRCRLSLCASAVLVAFGYPAIGAGQTAERGLFSERYSELEPYTLTATRTPVAASLQASVVDSFSADELNRRQVNSFAQALALASVPVFSSGQLGGSTSIFLRGANSNQTLFLVDGLRISDPN